MAGYSTSSPPRLVVTSIDDQSPQEWSYTNTDADATVYAAGYITNGKLLGMRKGDIVKYYKSDGPDYYIHLVVSVSAVNDSVTLSSTTVTHMN